MKLLFLFNVSDVTNNSGKQWSSYPHKVPSSLCSKPNISSVMETGAFMQNSKGFGSTIMQIKLVAITDVSGTVNLSDPWAVTDPSVLALVLRCRRWGHEVLIYSQAWMEWLSQPKIAIYIFYTRSQIQELGKLYISLIIIIFNNCNYNDNTTLMQM